MGAWGLESCSNDACWDQLDCLDIHSPSDKEIAHSLTKTRGCLTGSSHDKEMFVGVVVWGLTHNNRVALGDLKSGIKAAKSMLKDKEYLSEWVARPGEKTRKAHLQEEIKLMEEAAANQGQCVAPQTAPEGLLSKMSKD